MCIRDRFIIMLIWIQVSQYYDQYIQKQKVIYLQKIANMDMLTEAMNRNAYEDICLLYTS